MSLNFFKNLILAVVGIVASVVLFFFKKRKNIKLEEIKKQEEEERERIMEEEWEKQRQLEYPDLVLLKEIDPLDFEEVKAYDGNLNPMTFNLVKKSKAFETDTYFLEDEDMSWLEASTVS